MRANQLIEELEEIHPVNEEKGGDDAKEAISAAIETEVSSSNDDQGKFVQLLKGLAFSEDPVSDKFMKRLMKMVDKDSFGDLTE